jgi:hypothetical protein
MGNTKTKRRECNSIFFELGRRKSGWFKWSSCQIEVGPYSPGELIAWRVNLLSLEKEIFTALKQLPIRTGAEGIGRKNKPWEK